MRSGLAWIATTLILCALASPAIARDRVSKTVTMRISFTGSVSVDYGQDPGPKPGPRVEIYGRYSASWNWTKTYTSTYRRRPARSGGEEYFDRTVEEWSASVNESSSVVRYEGAPAELGGTVKGERCDGSESQPGQQPIQTSDTTSGRLVTNSPLDPPDRRFPFAAVLSDSPKIKCGADHAPQGANLGMDLESICAWACTLPAGKKSNSVTASSPPEHDRPRHQATGSYTMRVVVSTSKGDKKVRNRLPKDF